MYLLNYFFLATVFLILVLCAYLPKHYKCTRFSARHLKGTLHKQKRITKPYTGTEIIIDMTEAKANLLKERKTGSHLIDRKICWCR